MSYSTTMTAKGQITVPAAFREKLGLIPGKKVTVELKGNAIVVNAPVDFAAVRANIRAHMTAHHPEPITREEIDQIKAADLNKKYFTQPAEGCDERCH